MIRHSTHIIILLLIALGLNSCIELKPNAMYIDPTEGQEPVFFASSEIYRDFITSEMWVTPAPNCVEIEAVPEAAFEGNYGLHIKWDAISQECPWLGFGVGWDNWTGKDLSRIKNVAALEFYVKSLAGDRSSLPWGVGLEDFSGSQAWLGVFTPAVKAEKISSEWTRIEMPLSEFNWEEQGADPSNIKQIIFNLNADGDIFMDEIRIVEYSGGYRQRFALEYIQPSDLVVDGEMDDALYSQTSPAQIGDHTVYMALDGQYLCLGVEIRDGYPLDNARDGDQIWNGDALEIAFSTDPTASPRRTNFLLSDRHLGIKLGEEISGWDWSKKKAFDVAEKAVAPTETGVAVELRIDLSALEIPDMRRGVLYGLEMALDLGDASGRKVQLRWNSGDQEGFHQNPSIWGEMIILEPAAKAN